jgi:ribosomal protein L37AE/L43A
MTSNDDKANPTGYSEKSEGGIAETTCPKCGSSQVAQHPLTGEWTCLYCRAKWGATQTKVVSVDDENAVRGADIAIDRVFVCPNCGGKDLKQDGYTGKWMCQDCRCTHGRRRSGGGAAQE